MPSWSAPWSPTTPPTAGTPDVPMVIPEINNDHLKVIADQRKRLGTTRGFIAVKSNCSIQSYVPALSLLKEKFGLKQGAGLHLSGHFRRRQDLRDLARDGG